jgi:DNA primase
MEIPRLHPETIADVKQRVDIIDVVADRVVLRKRGRDYLGLCPFHDEKTPSFSVSTTKQMYYCFGCGAGGGAIKFLMEVDKASFSDVVLELAKRYQVPIKTLEPEQRQELQRQLSIREQLYEILAVTTSFYENALRQTQGEEALNYLKLQRGLQENTLQKFQIGYAPSGWDALYRYLVEVKRYPVGLVETAGLIKARKESKGYFDIFRNRIAIPIKDIRGSVIGFGTRILSGGENEPKYLNSPETPLFDKSKTLFALDLAKNAIAKEDRGIIVEGYFDAIALHEAGIENAVACLGTALTEDGIKQLLRYTESKQIILNFDADKAGIGATERAIQQIERLIYSGQIQLRILNLPAGKDADEFLKSSLEAIELYRLAINTAPLWLDWSIDRFVSGKNLKQADNFQQIAKNMLQLLERLQDKNLRAHYIGHCAQILGQGNPQLIQLNIANLQSQLKNFGNFQQKFIPKSIVSQEQNLVEEAEEVLLLIYLHCPEYRKEILLALEEKDLVFAVPEHRFLWATIWEAVENLEEDNLDSENKLLTQLQENLNNKNKELGNAKNLLVLNENNREFTIDAGTRIKSAIFAIEQVACEKYRLQCLEKWQRLNPSKDRERMDYYHQEIQKIEQKIEQLRQLRLLNKEN